MGTTLPNWVRIGQTKIITKMVLDNLGTTNPLNNRLAKTNAMSLLYCQVSGKNVTFSSIHLFLSDVKVFNRSLSAPTSHAARKMVRPWHGCLHVKARIVYLKFSRQGHSMNSIFLT